MSDRYETNFVEGYQPGSDACVELKNGKILDVINGCYLESGTSIILKDEKIISLSGAPDASSDRTPDFTIDLQGKAVMPGLFNTHCHIDMTMPTSVPRLRDIKLSKRFHKKQMVKNMAECLAHGITNIRDAMTADLRPVRNLKEKISRREIPGPRIWQSILVGPPDGYLSENIKQVMRLLRSALGVATVDYEKAESGVVIFPIDADEKQVRGAVDRAVEERGADFIKIGEQRENMISFKPDASIMSMVQLKALTDQTRERGLKSTMHHVSVESFRRGVQGGVSSLAHAPFDAPLSQDDVRAFNAAGCIIEPTLSVSYDLCWKIEDDPFYNHPKMDAMTEFRNKTYTDLMDEYWIPELRECVNKSFEKITAGRLKLLGLLDMSGFLKYYSGIVAHGTENLKLLFKQGARMALGNDGGVPVCTPAMMGLEVSIFDQVLNQNSGDLPFRGIDAVRIATINSALALGMEESFGSIESGKTADLVIVDGDPLEDCHVVGSRVAALFMDGKLAINNCGLQVDPVSQ